MSTPSPDLIASAAALKAARKVVVFTGAGVSAESGIATFRDAMTGLWSRFNAEDLATPEAFLRDPSLVWAWYESRRQQVLQSQPNAGHCAIATLAQHVPDLCVVTQNVDDLHERAGSSKILHLHGSLFSARCFTCSQPAAKDWDQPGGRLQAGRLAPPICTDCGGLIRPGVVWFGESLPESTLKEAFSLVRQCDVMLVIGTSGVVRPAAELPYLARANGCTVIQVNDRVSELDGVCHHNLAGRAGDVLPKLVGLLVGHQVCPFLLT
jgi:NAD-dependent deacetylase